MANEEKQMQPITDEQLAQANGGSGPEKPVRRTLRTCPRCGKPYSCKDNVCPVCKEKERKGNI
ncbi:MAG: hypothetical protein PHI27_05615 [Eubacteriales bacterium]|nr:hypothetical protein [Eubacteriales bacterium]